MKTVKVNQGGNVVTRLADERQSIGGVTQLTVAGIDEMVTRKHDLDYQLALCKSIMKEGDILPFPFERVVILLCKNKRHLEALSVCEYIKSYSEAAEKNWDGISAMIWRSPKLEKCVSRIPMLQAIAKS